MPMTKSTLKGKPVAFSARRRAAILAYSQSFAVMDTIVADRLSIQGVDRLMTLN
ncbi:MAG: hypothetical protein ACKVKW_04935 [Flavobacteriales bacterium]|jgi:hypothetical protein